MREREARAGSVPLAGGDVLLYRGRGWISRAIRFFDGSDVSHAALYLGDGSVGEALPEGLRERSLAESVAGAEWVLAGRLKSGADSAPVLVRARGYLDQGPRYAYEQILLLAVLTVIRRLPATASLQRFVRLVLDRAAEVLAQLAARATGGEPMICSEFVYRCYDEALPGPDDPYTLSIGAAHRLVGGAGGDASSPRIDPDSLLGQACRLDTLRRPAPEREVAGGPAPAPTDADLEDAFERYVREVGASEPPGSAGVRGAELTPEVLAALDRFAARFVTARIPGPGDSAVLESFLAVAADFVTPGDLRTSDSLVDVGRVAGHDGG